MSQNKCMLKNKLEKQSECSQTSDSWSLAEEQPSLMLPSFSNTDRPPAPPPPPTACDPSSPNTSRTGAPPADTVKEDVLSPCDYGEPMRPQRLVLDFTPIQGVDDNVHNMKKVLDFWKFIGSIPGLDNLRASPEDMEESETGEEVSLEESENDDSDKSGTVHNAENAIAWMSRDHMMSAAFAARQRGRRCEQGSGDYFGPGSHNVSKRSSPKPGTSHLNFRSKEHSEGHPASSRASAKQTDVHTLCKQLEEWDHLNPSTPEQPATNRGYKNAVLQAATQNIG